MKESKEEMKESHWRALLIGPVISAVLWGFSTAGMLLSYSAYEIGGKYLMPVFMTLYAWPLYLLKWYDEELHSSILGTSEAFTSGLAVTFTGWLLLSPIFSYAFWRRQHKLKAEPVASGQRR